MTNTEYFKTYINNLKKELEEVKVKLHRKCIFNDLLIQRLNSIIDRQHLEIQNLQLEIQRMINEKMVNNG